MKRANLLIIFFVLAVSAISAQSLKFSGEPYDAPAFSATYPVPDGQPVKQTTQHVERVVGGGSTDLMIYALRLQTSGDAFMVAYSDVSFTPKTDTAGLDAAIDGQLNILGKGAKAGPKTDSTYSGLTARAVSATGTANGIGFAAYIRLAVQGRRVWQGIVVCTIGTNCSEADANKFFNSIKIK